MRKYSETIKTIFHLIFFTLLMLVGKIGIGQKPSTFSQFTLFEKDNLVYLTCVIQSGSTCNGIKVYRIIDQQFVTKVGEIAGVCGSSNGPVTYNFIDSLPPKNIPLYYTLELGGYGYTDTLFMYIPNTEKKGFQIVPHPVQNNAIIYFENPANQLFLFTLVDVKGSTQLIQSTKNGFFELSVSEFPSGIYPFRIFSEESLTTLTGNLVIKK